MKKDSSYYFSHDSNAKDDPKIVLLIESLGLEGYGIYWILIELLRDQEDFKYSIALIPSIARRYNSTADKVKAVVTQYALFQFDENDFFYSKSLIERMLIRQEIRDKKSIAGKKSAEKRQKISTGVEQTFNTCSTPVEQTFNTISTHVEQEKKRKEKRIFSSFQEEKTSFPSNEEKEEFSKSVSGHGLKVVATENEIPLTPKRVLDYNARVELHKNNAPELEEVERWVEMNAPKMSARSFFDFWQSCGWLDSKANPIQCKNKIAYAKKDGKFMKSDLRFEDCSKEDFEQMQAQDDANFAMFR